MEPLIYGGCATSVILHYFGACIYRLSSWKVCIRLIYQFHPLLILILI